ncbi:hypothetical protein CEQ90_13870 [Lewinellaceae bacterium SD302]|nr:hypothetical protein CEQ90_13870 [Lewinellaceae bacterium SD302]
MQKFILFILLACLPFAVQAQLSKGGVPYSFSNKTSTTARVPVYTTPSIDREALMAEDEIDLQSNLPLRFAFGHEVSLDMDKSGNWELLSNGDRLWRLTIVCPEAVNINLLYNDFYLPKGATLYLYGETGEQVLGAFTEENNKASGRFASALVHGEQLTLEYYEPDAVKGEGRISISQIGHGYRSLSGQAAGTEKMSGDCQVDVNCSEGIKWQDEKKGVARMVMDGLYLCTGTLVNTTASDCKPIFLTANHCLAGGVVQDAVANPDVSGYVFYWNYEVPECGSLSAAPEQTTTGGTVLANAGLMTTGTHTLLSSDFALIQLAENPRGAYDVYFNGWDATGDQGNTGVGIHHPAGDVKKISTHNVVPEVDGYYWSLFWSATENGHSVTEGGSSGSALFRENGLIIGQLFGGGSVNCDDPANDLGLYGKLSYSWTNDDEPVLTGDPRRRLLDWLDPIGQGNIRSVGGSYDPCETKMVYFKSSTATLLAEENTNSTDGCREYIDLTYEIGITPYPSFPVETEISFSGTATSGAEEDFELLTSSVTFNNVTNSQTFTVRVYDDAYVEAAESINFNLTPFPSNGEHAAVLEGADQLSLTIENADVIPQGHVQTVRNQENPAEAFLGPNATVYYSVPGSGGLIMAVENNSDHSFGCTEVVVDNAGGTANNSWMNGTTVSKTIQFLPEHPGAGNLHVQLYYGNGEINGWEWFNNQGLDATDLRVITFAGSAEPANQGSATTYMTTQSAYGDDHIFSATINGFPEVVNGLTLGSLGNGNVPDQLSGQGNRSASTSMLLAPNVTQSQSLLSWNETAGGSAIVSIVNMAGQEIYRRAIVTSQGYNSLGMDASAFSPGIYLVRIQHGESGEYSQARLIRQ